MNLFIAGFFLGTAFMGGLWMILDEYQPKSNWIWVIFWVIIGVFNLWIN